MCSLELLYCHLIMRRRRIRMARFIFSVVQRLKNYFKKCHIVITYITSSKIYRKYRLVFDMLSSMNNNCEPCYKSIVNTSLMVCIFVLQISILY